MTTPTEWHQFVCYDFEGKTHTTNIFTSREGKKKGHNQLNPALIAMSSYSPSMSIHIYIWHLIRSLFLSFSLSHTQYVVLSVFTVWSNNEIKKSINENSSNWIHKCMDKRSRLTLKFDAISVAR